MGSTFGQRLVLGVFTQLILFGSIHAAATSGDAACSSPLTIVPTETLPVGFVSDKIVKQFTLDSPVLLTETHLRALGRVLREMGLNDVFAADGGPKNHLARSQKNRAIGFLKNPDVEMNVAERVWEELEDAFELRTPMLLPAQILALADNSAYQDSSQFVAARNALIAHIPERRQIVELLRLASPLAVRLALQNRNRRQEIITLTREAAVGLGVGALTKVFATAMSLLYVSDPTNTPLHLAVGAGVVTATGLWVRDHVPPRVAVRWLRFHNNLVLKAKGLRGRDGENTFFVASAFDQGFAGETTRPDVKTIEQYQPSLRIGDDDQTINELLRFGTDLQNLSVQTNDYMLKTVEHWALKTVSIGEPVEALTAFFQGSKATTNLPSRLGDKLVAYQKDLAETHTRLTSVRREFAALAQKTKEYLAFLAEFKIKNQGRLGAATLNAIERREVALNETLQAVTLFNMTTEKHMQNLGGENETIGSAQTALAALRNAGSLRAEQSNALFQLMKTVSDKIAQLKMANVGGSK